MAGQKREARLRARCPGHPRLCSLALAKSWMPGTSPGMTLVSECHDEVRDVAPPRGIRAPIAHNPG